MAEAEADFWSWVAQERARSDLERAEEVPDIVTWLEREIAEAREAAYRQFARREDGAEYWTGYADALEDVLKAIQRREVRA
ncbi:MAG: hypothetical protein ABGW50_05385 [Thermococcus sp.]